MIADLSSGSAPPDWDLPAGLRPDDASATMPNENLLCWRKRARLTEEQREIIESENLSMDISHVANVPICRYLLLEIASQLVNFECEWMRFPTSPQGSQAQAALISRSRDENDVEVDRNIAAKTGRTNSYTQASSHIASGAAIFRYRIQRRTNEEIDCVGYRFKDNEILQSWYRTTFME